MRYSAFLGFMLAVTASGVYAQTTAPAAAQGAVPGAKSPATIPAGPVVNPPAAGTLTGVPKYRAGFRGRRGTTAPVANADVVTAGDANGDGKIDSTVTLGPDVARFRNNSLGIKPGTPIVVKLAQTINSGSAQNGQTVRGTLVQPVGGVAAGSPVQLTVVAAAAAGQLSSAGEISVQVVSINGSEAMSQVVTAEGKEGRKDLPDAAPARGTEAEFTPDVPLSLPAA